MTYQSSKPGATHSKNGFVEDKSLSDSHTTVSFNKKSKTFKVQCHSSTPSSSHINEILEKINKLPNSSDYKVHVHIDNTEPNIAKSLLDDHHNNNNIQIAFHNVDIDDKKYINKYAKEKKINKKLYTLGSQSHQSKQPNTNMTHKKGYSKNKKDKEDKKEHKGKKEEHQKHGKKRKHDDVEGSDEEEGGAFLLKKNKYGLPVVDKAALRKLDGGGFFQSVLDASNPLKSSISLPSYGIGGGLGVDGEPSMDTSGYPSNFVHFHGVRTKPNVPGHISSSVNQVDMEGGSFLKKFNKVNRKIKKISGKVANTTKGIQTTLGNSMGSIGLARVTNLATGINAVSGIADGLANIAS